MNVERVGRNNYVRVRFDLCEMDTQAKARAVVSVVSRLQYLSGEVVETSRAHRRDASAGGITVTLRFAGEKPITRSEEWMQVTVATWYDEAVMAFGADNDETLWEEFLAWVN